MSIVNILIALKQFHTVFSQSSTEDPHLLWRREFRSF